MLIIGILILIVFIGGVGGLAKAANRPVKSGRASTGGRSSGGKRASRSTARSTKGGGATGARSTGSKSGRAAGGKGGQSKPSWFFKAWNASGAPKTSESSFRGASAVLTGKAAGATVRGGWWVSKKTGNAGRWFAGRALIPFDKWLANWRRRLDSAAATAEQSSSTDSTTAARTAPTGTGGTVPRPRVGRNVTMAGATGNVGVPATLAAHIDALNGAEFEDDAEYLNWLAGEVAGALAYAEALAHIHDRALNGEGLDPQAIRGLADLSDAKTEFADRAKGAHSEFNEVYNAVIGFVQDGGKLPNNGRWITGESAA